jgi:hypothetical protein
MKQDSEEEISSKTSITVCGKMTNGKSKMVLRDMR